jgi:hypothetical protein
VSTCLREPPLAVFATNITLTPALREDWIAFRLQEDQMSDWQPDFDQFEADLHDRDAQTSSPEKILIYVDNTMVLSTEDHSRLLASLNLARDWFSENNPAGVDFDYEVIK